MGWVTDRVPVLRRAGDPGRRLPNRRGVHWPRTVPAAVIPGVELIHLGGGESLPCPDASDLPLDASSYGAGFGTARLALPPARVHVIAGAIAHPGQGVVTTADGRIVAESVTTAMVGKVPLDDHALRADPVVVDGSVAILRSPLRSEYHTLVDDLPRAGLLIHPAVGRVGNMTVLHDGPLTPLEATLLVHLGGRRVRLEEVDPSRPVKADRVVVANFVTRPGAGAVPSWYRRWSDNVPLPPAGQAHRRVLLDSGMVRTVANRTEVLDVLERHGVVPLDPAELEPPDLLAALREAELVVGTVDGGLTGCLFSHRAHMVELLDGLRVDPAMYYLAASKGLPYDFVPAASGQAENGSGRSPRRSASASLATPTVDVGWLDRLLDRIVT